MKLELIDILVNDGAASDFEGDIYLQDNELSKSGVSFAGPLHIKARAENIGLQVILSVSVSTKISTICARCLKEIFKDVDFEFTERIAAKGTDDKVDEEIIFPVGSEVDIDELVLKNFITVSPVKYLCKEDCKGICPKCGADRNQTDCGCDSDALDPRFDILNDLFK